MKLEANTGTAIVKLVKQWVTTKLLATDSGEKRMVEVETDIAGRLICVLEGSVPDAGH